MDSQSGTLNINISDSAYSKSTNSNSQRSASSKSHPSGSNSSKTSGYDGATNGANECLDVEEQALIKHNKDKEHKKKKSKSAVNCNGNSNTLVTGCLKQNENFTFLNDVSMGVESLTYYNAKSSTKQSVPACNPNELINAVDDGVKTPLKRDNLKNPCNEISMQNDVSGLVSTPIIDQLEPLNKITSPQVEDGFCCVISMSDGLVLFTSPNITNILGFSADMWLGRSFTDFIHPKDRDTFCNQVTTGVAIPLIDAMGKKRDTKSSLYVYLRKYKGLRRSGFGVIEKNVRYQAFHLTVTFKNSTEYANSKDLGNNGGIFLVIVAVPIYSSYKVPDEKTRSKKFIMRHTSACIFSHVDADVVMNFGYFPQDMLGKSVFDFYHPEDMPFMKDVYESVMTNCHTAGSVYRSKPYRFAIRNGDFVMVETEWSSFLNPWSRRLEFITGLHQVLQGPANPDSFEVLAEDKTKSFSQNILREAKVIQDEILFLLKKELVKPVVSARFEVSSRCKNLSTFMDTIMSEVIQTDLKVNSPINHNVSVSERESVMLGEISPHHDFYDRQSSSETPPSYNQLNYNENLQRFFKSKPMTTSESAEKPSQLHNTADLFVKDLPPHQESNQKWLSPIQTSGDSGSGSAENLSSESSPNMDVTSATNTSNDSYSRPHLTQELLLKHNVDMENIMQQRHREKRSNFKADKGNSKYFQKNDKKVEKENGIKREEGSHHHGIKRSLSGSWDGDNHKISKYHHHVNSVNEVEEAILKNKGQNDVTSDIANNCNDNCYMSKTKNINLWPPFSVSMTSFGNNPPHSINTNANPIGTYLPGMFPTYCFQTQQGHAVADFNLNNHTSHFQVQYVPSMMYNYNPIFSPTSATFCPQVAMLPYPHFSPLMAQPNQKPATGCVSTTNELMLSPHVGDSVSELQRCRSQTSIKAEPGSAIGSTVSACNFNQAMSDCSRKDCCLFSVCSPDFPFVSSPDGEGYLNCGNLPEKNTDKVEQTSAFNMIRQDEESSYSSFYSSFLKTDTGSGSNDDSIAVGSTNTCKDKEKYEKPKTYSIKKFDPPWLEAVSVTPDFVYRYQMTVKNLENILESDLKVLKSIEQPLMVNDQLEQLYLELDLAGLSTKLTLEEGITSSSSNSGDESTAGISKKLKRRRNSYSSLTMIYEENAPLPPAPDYK